MRGSVAFLLAMGLVASLAGTAAADMPSIEDQRSAIMACKRIKAVDGAAYIEQRRSATYRAGQMNARIVPYDQVSSRDAAAINACAAERLGLGAAQAAFYKTRKGTALRSVRQPAGYPDGCGKVPVVLFRGDLYCQWDMD
ncbi:MAG: hypothetical protein ACK5JR_05080 [Tropicimonas sp.]|uniref:hypothetical protein n=1 Tax=Tropicimonas sp. TaxID=2067044 RepID=UPI003A888CF8